MIIIKYDEVQLAVFIQRPNRFIAYCRLVSTQEVITVHVKNTGRCQELLLPDVLVAVSYQNNPKRKTQYDLVAVKKQQQWINIDSQIPNTLIAEGLAAGKVELPGLTLPLTRIKREYKYKQSKLDVFVQAAGGQEALVEIKGMTLVNDQIGAFPDAPSVRALKHVKELTEAAKNGYQCYVIFVVQLEEVALATIHSQMQPKLHEAFADAAEAGVHVLAYTCQVSPDSITLNKRIPFQLDYPFIDPNSIGNEEEE